MTKSGPVRGPARGAVKWKPAGTILAGVLLAATAFARPAGTKRETAVRAEQGPSQAATAVIRGTAKVPAVFEEGEPLSLMIPAIGLQTELGVARLHQGRLDSSELKKSPVMITSAARSTLCRIGDIGISLILGHRQWKEKPLVFARLNELADGDTVVVAGQDRTLTFEVYRKITIKPAEIWTVVDEECGRCIQWKRPVIILVTCTPYGFNWRRLLVFAAYRDSPVHREAEEAEASG